MFSAERSRIAGLRQSNQQFNDVCDDYELCMSVFERLLRRPQPDLKQISEYKELRKSLEEEILYYLNRAESPV
jgi:hypothetical protein